MAPSLDLWSKQSVHKGTPVVVKMENLNWSMVEIESPSDEDIFAAAGEGAAPERTRNKNAKQLTWVLLLRAHRAAGCLASMAAAALGLASAIRRRVASGRTDNDVSEASRGGGGVRESSTLKARFYTFIKVFLWLSIVLLGFEVAAYFKGWHYGSHNIELQHLLATSFSVKGVFDRLYSKWVSIRVEYLAPPLQFLANACIVLFLIQSLDRLVLCLGCFWIKFRNIKPVPKEDTSVDVESGEKGYFPMVLVQLPMCNEKEVKIDLPHFLSFVCLSALISK